jgi:prolipoprotein diacylglyceryltransferase
VGEDATYGVATVAVIAGIVGARLVHVVDCWTACGYAENPWLIPQIWTGGIAIWGAAVFGTLGGFVAAVRSGVPIGKGADAGAAGMGLGFAIGRIGDVINGEHHATLCGGGPGICVTYTHPDTLGQGPTLSGARFSPGPVHLAVAYDMVWDALSVAVALWLRRYRLSDGLIFWIWAAQYAVGRLLLGFLRVGDPTHVFGLRQDQVIALFVLAAAVPMLVRLSLRARPAAVAAA